MKILHVINSMATGGAEKLILETLPRYNVMGVEADVLLLNGSEHPFLTELKTLNCCKVFILGTSSPYRIKFIGGMISFFKRYDIIHAHLFPSNYFAAAAKRISRSRTPLVMTEHNTSNRRFRSRKLRWFNKAVYTSFDKIICINDEVHKAVVALAKVDEEKLIIINNGVDIQKFAQASAIQRHEINPLLKDDDFLLIQVSSFRKQKDQKTLLRALLKLPENVRLLLAGDGLLRDEHEQLVRELNLENRVFFLGIRYDVPDILKACDIGILSSHYEGFGLAAVEGMASGRPFIASDVPGLAQVAGGAGILFPPGDSGKLAEEILKLMTDKEYYNETAQKGIARAAQYDIQKMVDQHIAVYRALLK